MSDDRTTPDGEFKLMSFGGQVRLVRREIADMIESKTEIRAQQAEAEAERLRAQLDRKERKELYDRVIARFNRVHGQKKKTSLAQICAEMGAPYEAVRKYRLRTGKNKG